MQRQDTPFCRGLHLWLWIAENLTDILGLSELTPWCDCSVSWEHAMSAVEKARSNYVTEKRCYFSVTWLCCRCSQNSLQGSLRLCGHVRLVDVAKYRYFQLIWLLNNYMK